MILKSLQRDLEPLSRRGFIKAGVSIAAGVSAVSIVGCSSNSTPSPYNFSSANVEVLNKLIETMFPPGALDFYPASQLPMLDNISHLLGFVPKGLQEDLGVAITLFDYGAVILGLNLSRFIHLSPDAATRYVDEWQSGNEIQRGIISGLKKLVYTAYWREEETWQIADFDGPVSQKWNLPKLGNAPMPLN
ncbi:MAG: hypothetical protein MI976_26910 [Pseudomonadales bacterium]|nr:hypothetical protein [Pseudomonadales bacterium]